MRQDSLWQVRWDKVPRGRCRLLLYSPQPRFHAAIVRITLWQNDAYSFRVSKRNLLIKAFVLFMHANISHRAGNIIIRIWIIDNVKILRTIQGPANIEPFDGRPDTVLPADKAEFFHRIA